MSGQMKLVPVEPTEEMIVAGSETEGVAAVDAMLVIAAVHGSKLPQRDGWQDSPLAQAYRAMIAAAPPDLGEGMREAIAAEREACAQIADQWATPEQKRFGHGGPGDAIRRRSLVSDLAGEK